MPPSDDWSPPPTPRAGARSGRVRAFVAAVKARDAEHPAAHRRLEQPLAIRARPWLPVEQRRFFAPRAGALLDPASQTVEHALAPPYRRQGAPGARHHLVIGQGRIAYDRVLVSGPWAASAGVRVGHRRSALREVDGDLDVVGRVRHDKRPTDSQEIVERSGAFRQQIKRQLNRNFDRADPQI